MKRIPKPIRIEPAFAERDQIRAMFEWYATYRALASFAPEGIEEETQEQAKRRFFRGSGESGRWGGAACRGRRSDSAQSEPS